MNQPVAVECKGGPHDGAIVRFEPCKVMVFARFIPRTGEALYSTYAYAVQDGRFVLKYLNTHSEALV